MRIYSFYIDSNDDFWFGFDGAGLARWRNGRLARYGHQIGNPHNFVYYFAEDTEGYFWLGLRTCLVRVGKADLNAFLDGTAASEPKESFYDTVVYQGRRTLHRFTSNGARQILGGERK